MLIKKKAIRVENKMLTINNYLLSLKTGEIVSKRKEKKIWKQRFIYSWISVHLKIRTIMKEKYKVKKEVGKLLKRNY